MFLLFLKQEDQAKLFKGIVQIKPGELQNGGGSGLGLMSKYIDICLSETIIYAILFAVAKGIVELHGGKISVFSEGEGHGCTFSLTLPVHLANSEEDLSTPFYRQRSRVFPMSERQMSSSCSSSHIVIKSDRSNRERVSFPSLNRTTGCDRRTSYISDRVEISSSGSVENSFGNVGVRSNALSHKVESVHLQSSGPRCWRTVLVVDDATLNRKMIAQSL